jgi:predicted DsbA family dithiol-disulfide isomerase
MNSNQGNQKLKVEVWSDIMCPFCYIGKRNYEMALSKFEHADDIQIVWKSFQLDPTLPETSSENVYEYLAKRKGLGLEQVKQLHENVTNTAKIAGLEYNFDKTQISNSFKAHQLIQLAKSKNLGDEAEEVLFYAYFTEGKNLSDISTLVELGQKISLDEFEIRSILENKTFEKNVHQEIEEAQQIGVRGVPFFVFDRKYAVSGAQPVHSFYSTLVQAHKEWVEKKNITSLSINNEGESCDVNENC